MHLSFLVNEDQPIQNLLHNTANDERQVIILFRFKVVVKRQTRRSRPPNIFVQIDVAVLQINEIRPRMRPEGLMSQNLDDIVMLARLQPHQHSHFIRDLVLGRPPILSDSPENLPRETLQISLPPAGIKRWPIYRATRLVRHMGGKGGTQ